MLVHDDREGDGDGEDHQQRNDGGAEHAHHPALRLSAAGGAGERGREEGAECEIGEDLRRGPDEVAAGAGDYGDQQAEDDQNPEAVVEVEIEIETGEVEASSASTASSLDVGTATSWMGSCTRRRTRLPPPEVASAEGHGGAG